MPSLENKKVIVTGASSGIGRGIASTMADAGAQVMLVGRDEQRLEGIREQIAAAGGDSVAVVEDLTEDDAAARVVAESVRRFGSVDCVVNCAGVFLVGPPDASLEILDRQWRSNVRAPYRLAVAALPSLRESQGNIIFLSSIAGKVGFPGASAYCATKGAIEQITRALAVEEAPNGVRVNAIAPGNVETPMNSDLMADEDYKRAMLDATPLGRNGMPGDIAPAALLLASDDGAWITGQSIVVDGGWTAQ